MKIASNVADLIGNTPLVRLSRVASGVRPQIVAKLESANPANSVKDRIGLWLIKEAIDSGKLKPGGTIVECTSGNTGVGLAIVAAVLGYRAVFTMPDKMSREKQAVQEALGAEIVRTPTEAPHDSPESLLGVAERLNREIASSVIPDQYKNPDNPDAHYYGTGAEIWEDFGDSLDLIVIGAGTGGTIAGVAKYLKERNPKIKVVGVDPEGSILGGIGRVLDGDSPF